MVRPAADRLRHLGDIRRPLHRRPEPARRAEDLRMDGMPLLRLRGGDSALEHRRVSLSIANMYEKRPPAGRGSRQSFADLAYLSLLIPR